jgi:hypothetical protein
MGSDRTAKSVKAEEDKFNFYRIRGPEDTKSQIFFDNFPVIPRALTRFSVSHTAPHLNPNYAGAIATSSEMFCVFCASQASPKKRQVT